MHLVEPLATRYDVLGAGRQPESAVDYEHYANEDMEDGFGLDDDEDDDEEDDERRRRDVLLLLLLRVRVCAAEDGCAPRPFRS